LNRAARPIRAPPGERPRLPRARGVQHLTAWQALPLPPDGGGDGAGL